jgi:hypothetical protein
MGKKSKRIRNKLPKEYKTKEERFVEYNDIRQQFVSNGFKCDDEGIKDILDIVTQFYETGDGWSGKINIPYTKYKANIILTNNKHKKNLIKLEYDKSCK